MFVKQIELSLGSALGKYSNRRLGDIGEDMLVDVSEVLFNELAYYQLIKENGYTDTYTIDITCTLTILLYL